MAERPALSPAEDFLDALLDVPAPSPALTEVGTVAEVGDGIAVVAGLVSAHVAFGHANVLLYYWLPYLVVNYHLVLITYLQHTDVYVPHYDCKCPRPARRHALRVV